jgi:hypothetical protein
MALMLLGYLLTGLERVGARLRLNALGFFTYADWIRAQSLEQYLFHLGRLVQAGVAPATAHALAAAAVPNRALADALLSVELGRAEGAAHIDHALERSGLFPIEERARGCTRANCPAFCRRSPRGTPSAPTRTCASCPARFSA